MTELVYIDEQPAQAGQVLRSAVASEQFGMDQVDTFLPSSNIDDTIDMILERHCKVLITDYRLSDHKADVEFTGADLVREFRRRYAHFPCFVTTSFAEEAADEYLDTNMIFPKSDFLDRENKDPDGLPFFVRVRKKIAEYERMVATSREEFDELASRSDPLSASDTQRLIELDDLLESLHGNHQAVESHLKEQALAPIGALMGRAEELISKIENALDDGSKDTN